MSEITEPAPETPPKKKRRIHTKVVSIELSPELVRTKPIGAGSDRASPGALRELERKTARIGKRYLANAMLRLVELAHLDDEREDGTLLPLPASADRRVVMIAVEKYLERMLGKDPIRDPDIIEPTRPRFDPSLYSPEQLEQIEATLRLVQATQVRGTK